MGIALFYVQTWALTFTPMLCDSAMVLSVRMVATKEAKESLTAQCCHAPDYRTDVRLENAEHVISTFFNYSRLAIFSMGSFVISAICSTGIPAVFIALAEISKAERCSSN